MASRKEVAQNEIVEVLACVCASEKEEIIHL
jgi:hypothetical protein